MIYLLNYCQHVFGTLVPGWLEELSVIWLLPGLAPACLLVGIHILGENIRQGFSFC